MSTHNHKLYGVLSYVKPIINTLNDGPQKINLKRYYKALNLLGGINPQTSVKAVRVSEIPSNLNEFCNSLSDSQRIMCKRYSRALVQIIYLLPVPEQEPITAPAVPGPGPTVPGPGPTVPGPGPGPGKDDYVILAVEV
jgi:hypothetical protein